MALQWSSGNTPAFSPTLPLRVGATRQRENLSPAHMNFTIEFGYNPDSPPQPSDAEVLAWFQPVYDAMKAAGWEFHTLTQDAPPATRSIQEGA